MDRVLVFTATYNEIENIESLVQGVFEMLPDATMLIVDDNSPDGTGERVAALAKSGLNLNLIERPSKLGLGSAHMLAIRYAIQNNFDHLITMDADFSHHPKYLPVFTESLKTHDFVIGSRYVAGGSCDYGIGRTAISKSANILTRVLLGIPLHETTTSYRGFRVELLKKMNLDEMVSEGYSFFIESIYQVIQTTTKVKEFPIHFEDRQAGASKISKKEILKAAYHLFRHYVKRLKFKSALKEKRSIDNSQECEKCGSPHQTLYPYHLALGDAVQFLFSREQKDLIPISTKTVKCLQCGITHRFRPSSQRV